MEEGHAPSLSIKNGTTSLRPAILRLLTLSQFWIPRKTRTWFLTPVAFLFMCSMIKRIIIQKEILQRQKLRVICLTPRTSVCCWKPLICSVDWRLQVTSREQKALINIFLGSNKHRVSSTHHCVHSNKYISDSDCAKELTSVNSLLTSK